MKRINYILCLGLLSITSLVGCDSILDKGPLDRFTNDNFWSNAGNVEGYANTFYNQFKGYGNGNSYGLFYFKGFSDDQAAGSFISWEHDGNVPNTVWKDCYIEIRRANIMIERTPGIAEEEAVINHWLGVARLMRAQQYFWLVRMFGDVPYTDKSLDITDEGVLYGPRINRDEIMDKVLEDLNFATSNINDVASKTTWSRAMANAMKADICLFEGTFRKYRKSEDGQPAPDAAGAQKFLTACKDACVAVMGKNYELNDSYQGNYNSIDLKDNTEMIFYKAYTSTGSLKHSLIAYTATSTQMYGMSKDAFDAYLFNDGKPLALTSEDSNLIPPLVNGKLSLVDMLAVRDKRLSQTIDPVLMYVGNSNRRFEGDLEMTSSTGYGIRKYDNGEIPLSDRNNTSRNYTHAPIFWLSVIYLNYAEACAELGTITQDDLNKTINVLKDRAGLPHLTIDVGYSDPANNHGVSDLIWEIRRERRCELMFDNWFRYWDLIRWHQLDKLDSTTNPNAVLGGDVRNDPNCAALKVGNLIDGLNGESRAYDKKYYLYPVPTAQINLNNALKPNNPGW